ncbi:MAG: hypothetical protein H6832_01235 [Planctomycetes bacterium]|nr:hypothetical protein [Planctomycetota bacterium]MCB9917008.1 hypothetical protein [Planctomycetota bacterium]
MSTASVDALAHVPISLVEMRAHLIDVALGRLPKDAARLSWIRDSVEQRYADGDETEPTKPNTVNSIPRRTTRRSTPRLRARPRLA